jgi:hypothetical protein
MEELDGAIKRFSEWSKQALLRTLVAIPEVKKAVTATSYDYYRVVMDGDLAKGPLHLGQSSRGGYTPNLHGVKGKIMAQARLLPAEGLKGSAILRGGLVAFNAFYAAAEYIALQEVTRRLANIEQKLGEVLQGQQADRLGLLDSGIHLYVLASFASDDAKRQALVIAALAQLSQARGQLILEVRKDLRLLRQSTDRKDIARKALRMQNLPAEVERRASRVLPALTEVLRASFVIASACIELGLPFDKAWEPLGQLQKELDAAKSAVQQWVPIDRSALPDAFSTYVDGVQAIGDMTSGGLSGALYGGLGIDFSRHELLEESRP